MNKKTLFFIITLIIIGIIAVSQTYLNYTTHTNPPVLNEPQWDSPRTKELFSRACADCHSNETKWPGYSTVFPLSFFIQNHVTEGREHFNVSVWGIQRKNEGDDAAEEVRENEMPPFTYKLAHPEARLTNQEQQELVNGLEKTFKKQH